SARCHQDRATTGRSGGAKPNRTTTARAAFLGAGGQARRMAIRRNDGTRMKTQDGEILRRSSVFRFLSDEHFAAIEPLLQEEHYEFGDVIVKQDDPADSFYVLTKGRARALKIKPDGEEIPLGVLKPGDSFGEAALSEGG